MRRGSVSSWEPWARRNSANMAQLAGSRSEFMTSDVGLNDIEYKRNGGCFLSFKKIAAIIVTFIVSLIIAGVIGAYVSNLKKNLTIATSVFPENDEVDISTNNHPAKFSSSPLILPSLYKIELTPVPEESTVKKFQGRVIIHFNYSGNQPLSQLVFNAKGINVSEAKLFSFDDNDVPRNIHSRKRRDDRILNESLNNSNENINNSIDTTIVYNSSTNIPEVTTVKDVVDIKILSNKSSDDVLNVTSRSTNVSDNITTEIDVSSLTSTPTNIVILENDTYTENNESFASSKKPVVIEQRILPVVKSNTISPEDSTPIKSTEIRISKNETDTVDDFYVIYTDTPIQRGEYSVQLTYESKLDGQNTFANIYELEGQRKWLVGTKLKPLGPRTLFPSFDEPISKAKFLLSITRPKVFITLANMPLRSSESVSDDWVVDHFEKTPFLSLTNLAFLVGDVQPIRETTVQNTNIPLTLWDSSNKMEETNFIFNKIEAVTRILNQFFSTPYTLPKLDIVVVPGLVVNGIGGTGLIVIKESLFYLTEESSTITKEFAVKNLIKLISEQWLGGIVSMKTLSDAWIIEGSLIYLKHLLTDKIDPTFDTLASFGVVQHEALESDAYEVSKSLDSEVTLSAMETTYSQNANRKGACLIRMLHNVISDSDFRNGYKRFVSRWQNSNAGISDFWNAMSNVEAQWLPESVNLSEVMTSWVSQSGFPIVTIRRNNENGSVLVRQEQFSHYNSSTISKSQFWYIPLTYITDGDDWSSPRRSWLKQEEKITLEIVGKVKGKKWLLFNVNQTGYYRVNYDLDNWNLLSSALQNSTTFEKFPITTRTLLVDDALSLAWCGHLEYPTALNLIRYLNQKETHHTPWTVALQNMIKLNNLLQNTGIYSSFQEFMIKFISPIFKKVTSTSGGDSQLKLMAIKWACLIDNPECRSYLKSLYVVPEYLVETYECTLAKFGGKTEWDSLLLKTSNATDRETKLKLLAVFPCFQIEWILKLILNDILKGDKYDMEETIILLQSFSKYQIAARSAFKFLRTEWNNIFQRFSKSYPISKAFLIASINGITDEQDLKDFQIFKEENYDKLKFMGHTIAVAESEASLRISWLKINLLPVQMWLEEYNRSIS